MTSTPADAQARDLGFDPQQVLAAVADRAARVRPPAPSTLADAEAAVSARYPTASLIPAPDALDEDGLPDPTGGFYPVDVAQDLLTGIGYDPGQVAAALAAHARADYPIFIYVRELPDVVAELITPSAVADTGHAADDTAGDDAAGDDAGW